MELFPKKMRLREKTTPTEAIAIPASSTSSVGAAFWSQLAQVPRAMATGAPARIASATPIPKPSSLEGKTQAAHSA